MVISVLLQPRVWMTFLFLSLFRIQAEAPAPEAGFVTAGPVDGMEFAYIPSGSFMMGSPSSEEGRDSNEGPQHTVNISAFEMMTTEVTQGMWEEVMSSDIRDQYQRIGHQSPLPGEGYNYPMYFVSWLDCQEFIKELNDLDSIYAYRLPSEAEWEYACRAGTTSRYYWGDTNAEIKMKRYCWYSRNATERLWTPPQAVEHGCQPVGTREPNGWGLYDMAGNVCEWCEDIYHNDYSGAPTDGSAWLDEVSNITRVYRGGDWVNYVALCRSASRRFYGEDTISLSWGFRVVRTIR